MTIEESALPGGAGAGVLELLAQLGIACPALLLGLPDRFVDHGDIAKLHSSIGLDPAGIEASIRERFADLLSAPGDRAGRIKSVA